MSGDGLLGCPFEGCDLEPQRSNPQRLPELLDGYVRCMSHTRWIPEGRWNRRASLPEPAFTELTALHQLQDALGVGEWGVASSYRMALDIVAKRLAEGRHDTALPEKWSTKTLPADCRNPSGLLVNLYLYEGERFVCPLAGVNEHDAQRIVAALNALASESPVVPSSGASTNVSGEPSDEDVAREMAFDLYRANSGRADAATFYANPHWPEHSEASSYVSYVRAAEARLRSTRGGTGHG